MSELTEALPGYDVGDEIGRGAMGVVLAGRHVQLDRPVAIKQLPGTMAADAEIRERFGVEARVLASLTHPHIVPVYDYVEREGLCLLVMESLPGGTVWDRFTGQGLTMQTACSVVLATCAGLEHAHSRQVLHRDIKPENLMFDNERSLKVTDFGIAKVLSGDETLATMDGGVIGTPAYMAPEQAQNLDLGPQADVYATGTMLYELLSGQLPFPEADPVEMLEQRVREDPTPLRDVAPHVPEALAEAVMGSIERDPADRPATAEELGVTLGAGAAQSWGEDWLNQSDTTLMVSGAIAAAARTTNRPGAADTAPDTESRRPTQSGDDRGTVVHGENDDPVDPAARGRATRASASPDDARATAASGGGMVVSGRASSGAHAAGVDVAEIDLADLVSLREVLKPPPVPRPMIAITAALALLMVLVPIFGIGSPSRPAGLDSDAVLLNGQSVVSGDEVSVNLAEPIVLTTEFQRELAAATNVELRLSVLGIPSGTSTLGAMPPSGVGETQFGARSLRVLTNGDLTGDLRFLDENGDLVLTHEFGIEPDQAWWLTTAAVIAATLLVFVGAYVASVAAPLWLGRKQRSSLIALGALGALVGLSVTLWVWTIGGQEPTWATVVVNALLGIATFALAGRALLQVRRRARLLARERAKEEEAEEIRRSLEGSDEPAAEEVPA